MATDRDVVVYTTPTWPACAALKRFLSEKGIPYTEVDLTEDYAARKTVIQATGQLIVPQTRIGNEWVVGFDPQRLTELLGCW